MSSELLTTIVNGVTGLIGACIGAWFTLWLQSKKERVKRLEDQKLYVEYHAIKQDKEGYYIPGYGRIINSAPPALSKHPEVVKRKRKVAFICHSVRASDGDVEEYVIGPSMPI